MRFATSLAVSAALMAAQVRAGGPNKTYDYSALAIPQEIDEKCYEHIAGQSNINRPDKLWICHGTNSDNNPYVVINVDPSALDGHMFNRAQATKRYACQFPGATGIERVDDAHRLYDLDCQCNIVNERTTVTMNDGGGVEQPESEATDATAIIRDQAMASPGIVTKLGVFLKDLSGGCSSTSAFLNDKIHVGAYSKNAGNGKFTLLRSRLISSFSCATGAAQDTTLDMPLVAFTGEFIGVWNDAGAIATWEQDDEDADTCSNILGSHSGSQSYTCGGKQQFVTFEFLETIRQTPGLIANIWTNRNLVGEPLGTLVRPDINQPYSSSPPWPGNGFTAPTVNFSMRWEGSLVVDATDDYKFHGGSDDGIRIWLNGNKIINYWNNRGYGITQSGFVRLIKGKTNSIKVEFYNAGGPYKVDLKWSSSTFSNQLVPAKNFFAEVDPEIVLSKTASHFIEGGTDTIMVSLSAKPYGSVTMALDSTPDSLTFSPAGGILTFDSTNWNVPQALTIKTQTVATSENNFVMEVRDVSDTRDLFFFVSSGNIKVSTGAMNGLKAFYYNNEHLQLPHHRFEVVPNVNWNAGGGALVLQDGTTFYDRFSIMYEGSLRPDVDGEYIFTIGSDDGSKLHIGGNQVIGMWRVQSYRKQSSSPITLKAGQFYDIRYDFYERTGGARATLEWRTVDNSVPRQIIPQANLFTQSGPGLYVSPKYLEFSDKDDSSTTFKLRLNTQPEGGATVKVFIKASSSDLVVSQCVAEFNGDNWMETVTVQVDALPSFATVVAFHQMSIEFTTVSTCVDYNALTALLPVQRELAHAGTCTSWGDPHFVTWDRKKYNDYSYGDKFLIRHPTAEWVVQTRQQKCARVSCNLGVAVKYKGDVVVIEHEMDTPHLYVRSDGLPDGTKVTKLNAKTYMVSHPNGASVKIAVSYWGGGDVFYLNINANAPAQYFDGLLGMCGSFNDNGSDDLKGPDGANVSNGLMGKAWSVPSGESLFMYPIENVPDISPPSDTPTTKVTTKEFYQCEVDGTEKEVSLGLPEDEIPDGAEDMTDDIVDHSKENPNLLWESKPFVPDPDDEVLTGDPDWESPEQEAEAEETCKGLFKHGALFESCSQLTGMVAEMDALYEDCLFDAKITGSTEFGGAAAEVLVQQCSEKKKEQEANEKEDDSIPHIVCVIPKCPNLCNLHGTCNNGVCNCDDGFLGESCEVDSTSPLRITSITPNIGPTSGGNTVIVSGRGFVNTESVTCRFGSQQASAVMLTEWQVKCTAPPGAPGQVEFHVTLNTQRMVTEDQPLFFTYTACPVKASRRSLSVFSSGTAFRCYLGTCLYSSNSLDWHAMSNDVFALIGHAGTTLYGVAKDMSMIKSTDGEGQNWEDATADWATQCTSVVQPLRDPVDANENPIASYLPPTDDADRHDSDNGNKWWLTDVGVNVYSSHTHPSGNPVTSTSKWDCLCAQEA